MRVRAHVGIGSNLDDPRAQVCAALDALGRIPGTRLMKSSPLYRSAPVDCKPGDPDFVNAVAAVDTSLSAPRLLAALHAIERRHKRVRTTRNAARTLDLDLLLYGGARHRHRRLAVPHPRLTTRAFALRPLLDLEPGVRIAGRGRAARYLASTRRQPLARLGREGV